MNKMKNEAKLIKKALELGFSYAKQQGYGDLDKSCYLDLSLITTRA